MAHTDKYHFIDGLKERFELRFLKVTSRTIDPFFLTAAGLYYLAYIEPIRYYAILERLKPIEFVATGVCPILSVSER